MCKNKPSRKLLKKKREEKRGYSEKKNNGQSSAIGVISYNYVVIKTIQLQSIKNV